LVPRRGIAGALWELILLEAGVARFPRITVVGLAYHVTQRGNARSFILNTADERRVYLDLLRKNADCYGVGILGYCLMSNHVHLVATPLKVQSLALALKNTHGRYASYWNAVNGSSGHVWQGRYYSCPLDEAHLWEALRYTELNPVRASLVQTAESWPWSSAAIHCSAASLDSWLDMKSWKTRWCSESWLRYLNAAQAGASVEAIRQNTHSGRPLGSQEFTSTLERETQRLLTPQKRGPKKKVGSQTCSKTHLALHA
jgi:putative transposase